MTFIVPFTVYLCYVHVWEYLDCTCDIIILGYRFIHRTISICKTHSIDYTFRLIWWKNLAKVYCNRRTIHPYFIILYSINDYHNTLPETTQSQGFERYWADGQLMYELINTYTRRHSHLKNAIKNLNSSIQWSKNNKINKDSFTFNSRKDRPEK